MLYLQYHNREDEKEGHRIGDDDRQILHQKTVDQPEDDTHH